MNVTSWQARDIGEPGKCQGKSHTLQAKPGRGKLNVVPALWNKQEA
jgi:hypothetical protein